MKKYLPEITALLAVTLLMYAAVRGVPMETSIFADGLGKWLQIQGLVKKGIFDFTCVYNEPWDPEFKFIPGPWYVYSIQGSSCTYGYQAPYAMLVLPFVKAHAAGYYFLNWICFAVFAVAFIVSARRLLPFSSFAPWGALAIAVFVIPNLTFAMDLAEVSLAMALAAAALALLRIDDTWRITLPPRNALPAYVREHLVLKDVPAAGAGFLLGMVFALRTEAGIHIIFWLAAIALFSPKKLVSFGAGLAAALTIVFAFHMSFFGNWMGNRGSSHADVARDTSVSAHLKIAGILLAGGPLGLFTSLPSVLLGLLLFVPALSRKRASLAALALITVPVTLVIIFIAPSDGGYSWGPRFLALTFAPFFLLVLTAADELLAWRKWTALLLAAVFLYSADYTWKGRNVYRRAALQNAKYDLLLSGLEPEVIIVKNQSLFALLSRTRSLGRVFQADTPEETRTIAQNLDREGVRKIVLIRWPGGDDESMPGYKLSRTQLLEYVEFLDYSRARN